MLSLRILFLFLIGLLAMTVTPDAHAGSETESRVLTDFSDSTPDLGWHVVNDGVMGGRSEGGFVHNADGLVFAGVTNTNGGGFSSIRTRALRLDLQEYDGIRVRVRGDGRRYTWRLTTDARWRGRQVGFWADFDTKDGEWVEVDIPFADFKAQWRGRMLDNIPLDAGAIRGMGLMIYDNKDGPFEMRIEEVRAYSSSRGFSLEDERWQSRVLVVSAPAADDEALVRQLADIATSVDEFADRDMLLVVLLDEGQSRAGDRSLSAEEASAVRRAAGIDSGGFEVRLIGKDGGVKHSASTAAPMSDLYRLIDSMPMRRAETGR